MSDNPFSFILDFFNVLSNLAASVKSFLFTQVSVLGYTFSVWQLLGGSLLVTILVAVFIKAIL